MREQICNSTLVLSALTIIDKCNVRARPGTGSKFSKKWNQRLFASEVQKNITRGSLIFKFLKNPNCRLCKRKIR
jgi:hypothetical protein